MLRWTPRSAEPLRAHRRIRVFLTVRTPPPTRRRRQRLNSPTILLSTDYKADPYNGPVAHPDFSGKQKSYAQFRTRISDAVKGGVNFGGSLAIAEFGCGAECLMGFATDLQTGTVYDLPAGGEDNPELSLIYKPDSNLLLAQWTGGPDMDHPTCVHAFFQWTGGAFTPLQKREVQGQCPTPQ